MEGGGVWREGAGLGGGGGVWRGGALREDVISERVWRVRALASCKRLAPSLGNLRRIGRGPQVAGDGTQSPEGE